MSTKITEAHNQCYSIEISRFYGGDKRGVMFAFTISDGNEWHSITLPKKDAVKLALDLLEAATQL